MSFNEVLLELPALTFEQRQLLIRRALELDDAPLSAADESLVESRLAALREPLFTRTGRGHLKSAGVSNISSIKANLRRKVASR